MQRNSQTEQRVRRFVTLELVENHGDSAMIDTAHFITFLGKTRKRCGV